MRTTKDIKIDSWMVDLIRKGETFQCETREGGTFKSQAYRDERGALTFRDATGAIVVQSQLVKLTQLVERF